MGLSYIHRILYDSLGYTGNTYYYRLVQKRTGLIWDNVNNVLAVNPTWEDSAIPMSDTNSNGQYPAVVPAGVPAGTYDFISYKQSGSVPQNTDDVELQWDFPPIGGALGF